ncbi:MAG: ATP-binding protein [Nitrospirota bacterium]
MINIKGLIWLLTFLLFIFIAIFSFHTLSLISSVQKDLNDEFERRLHVTSLLIAREIEADFDKLINDPEFIPLLITKNSAHQILTLNYEGVDIRNKNGPRVGIDKSIIEKIERGDKVILSSYESKGRRLIKSAYASITNPANLEKGIVIVKMYPPSDKGEQKDDESFGFFKVLIGFVVLALIFYVIRSFMIAGRPAPKEGDEAKIKGDTGFLIHTFHSLMQQLKTKEQELQRLRTEAEERADVFEDYNEYVLKSVSSGVIAFDKKNKITTFNQAAEKILDFGGEELLGKSCSEAFGEESGLCQLLDSTLQRSEGSPRKELEIVKRSSERIWVGISASILKNRKDEAIGAILIFSDITEIKKLQDEIRQKDRLTVLGELAGGIAHEFRNMMGTILGFAKLLSKKIGKNDPKQGMIEAIINELNTMEMIINELLNLGKAQPISLKPVDINKALRNVLIKSMGEVKEPKPKIDVNIPGDIPEIMADELLIRQAFTNLIQNSVDAMSEGGELKVEGRYHAADGIDKMVEIAIMDTGAGIPKDKIDKIFLPFFTTKPKGTGLGLALVHKIILSHNGRIEVESEEGKGTTFKIFLPAATAS